MDLSVTSHQRDGRTVVTVGGEIDVYTAPLLRERIHELVKDGHHDLVIDLEAVGFLDSTGLGVLVGGLKRVRAHSGSMRLVCTSPKILKVFEITGLTKVFAIYNDVTTALVDED